MVNKVICLIPVRSQNSRIKEKHLIKFNKFPLIKYVCKNIYKSQYINEFHLLCDKKNYFKYIKNISNKFFFFKRSKSSSLKFSPTEAVIDEFFSKKDKNYETIVLLQITNPFINHFILDKALDYFFKNKYNCLLSAVLSKKFLWQKSKFAKPINYNYKKRKFSQNIKNYYVENGSFYIFKKENFLKYKNRLHKKIGIFEMSQESLFEIDEYNDIHIIRKLLKD